MDGGGGDDVRSSIKKWNVIYPVYLNSKKTVAEGRRIAAGKACPDPTCVEIADCCSYLKIPHAIELDKAYPRDFFQVGRVRVQLKKDDGSAINPAIKTKKQLLIQIAELVPKHHGRTKKQEPAASSAAGTSKGGKGGKKKNAGTHGAIVAGAVHAHTAPALLGTQKGGKEEGDRPERLIPGNGDSVAGAVVLHMHWRRAPLPDLLGPRPRR
uniref:Signal recognition particle 19 kDa protein n=1 Tax=Leersia perrieri TaxID=77586 RepID=A0A0D9WGF0_9ORYZ